MRKVTQNEFDSAYELHQMWLKDSTQGEKMVFVSCDLRGIKFHKKADLRWANFIGSDLSEADFSEADLCDAYLFAANLIGSNLFAADFTYAVLNNALHSNIFSKPDGRLCIWVPSEKGIIVHAGCFRGTINEFEATARAKHGNKEPDNYAAEIKMLREIEQTLQK